MNRPDKVKVLSTDFTIKWMTREEEEEHGKFGFFCPITATIGISERLSPTKQGDTFLHELLHAIFWITSEKDIIGSVPDALKLEEIMAGNISAAMQAIIRDNPEVVAWYLNLLRNKKEESLQEIFRNKYATKE